MRHEKTIKRHDGSRVKIEVTLYIDIREIMWEVNVLKSEPNKRKFLHVADTDSYKYRALSLQEREVNRMKQYLEHVTPEEIYTAKLELWEKLKQTM